ncbi:MAG: hypothetical protein JWO04_1478 [Gammaproteobacteria bacterium]|nr:hypothetical protein [Gammaproteobacteria bacterium]
MILSDKLARRHICDSIIGVMQCRKSSLRALSMNAVDVGLNVLCD